MTVREFQTSVNLNRIGCLGVSPRGTLNYHHRSSRQDLTKHVMLIDNKRMVNVTKKWFVADGSKFLAACVRGEPRPNSYYYVRGPLFIDLVRELTSDLVGPVAIKLVAFLRDSDVVETIVLSTFWSSQSYVASDIYFFNEADAVQFSIKWQHA